MKDLNQKHFKSVAKLLLAFTILSLFFVISPYVIRFGGGLNFGQQNEFAQFGDYLGGVLNPILSFATIFLLLFTVKLQIDSLNLQAQEVEATRLELSQSREAAQEQIRHMKVEAKKADVYKTIQVLEERLEGLYREPVFFVSNGILRERELYFLLSFATEEALQQIIKPEEKPSSEFETQLVKTKSVLMQLHITVVKLSIQLTLLLQHGPNEALLFFYEPTLNHLAEKLKKVGYLPEADELTLKINSDHRGRLTRMHQGMPNTGVDADAT